MKVNIKYYFPLKWITAKTKITAVHGRKLNYVDIYYLHT